MAVITFMLVILKVSVNRAVSKSAHRQCNKVPLPLSNLYTASPYQLVIINDVAFLVTLLHRSMKSAYYKRVMVTAPGYGALVEFWAS